MFVQSYSSEPNAVDASYSPYFFSYESDCDTGSS